jgi:hypothetical protein
MSVAATIDDMLRPRFTADDAQRAHDEWGANCGPGALAAICGLSLDAVRPHMGGFEDKRYTNPTLMINAVRSLCRADLIKGYLRDLRKPPPWPYFGLARIQWEGPWTAPGANPRWAYRQTHWVGVCQRNGAIGIFDINMINNGSGWSSLENWRTILVPWLLKECVPRADGKWHITHAIEVQR